MTNNTPPKTPSAVIGHDSSNEPLTDLNWQIANFTMLVAITSGLIAIIHSPLNTMMFNQLATGRLLESNTTLLIAMRQLYAGFGACFTSIGTRTAYISGTKKIDQNNKITQETTNREEPANKTNKEVKKYQQSSLENIGYISAMSLGDVIVSQIPEALSALRKIGINQSAFKWYTPYNLVKLGITSSGSRLGFGIVNFISIYEAEQIYLKHLSIQDKTVKHFAAGTLSGMTAAICSYPFSLYRDYHLSRMTVNHGKLMSPGTINLFSEGIAHIKSAGFYSVFKSQLKDFVKQAPLRMARTGSRFAMISGVAAWCQNEPLSYFAKFNNNDSDALGSFGLFKKSTAMTSSAETSSELAKVSAYLGGK